MNQGNRSESQFSCLTGSDQSKIVVQSFKQFELSQKMQHRDTMMDKRKCLKDRNDPFINSCKIILFDNLYLFTVK